MRKTSQQIAELLFHAYEIGDIDNIFYNGNWSKMSAETKHELDNIELEDLGTVKEYSYGVILNRIHREIDQEFIFSMVMENNEKNIRPEITSLHFMIAGKYFSVLKDGKKISPALYATPQKLDQLAQPLLYELKKYQAKEPTEGHDPKYYEIRSLIHKIAVYNPFFYALKTSQEFINADIRTLCLVIEEYLNTNYKITNELLERSEAFNNIENWADLFPRTKRDLNPLFTFARRKIGQQQFLSTPQNKEINTLISSFVDKPTAGQLDIMQTLEIQVNDNFILKFDDIQLAQDDVTPISVKTANGMKTLVIFLQEYAKHKNEKGDVRISLDEIQQLRNYNNVRTARKQTLAALKELSKIGFQVKERGKSSGFIRLNGGTATIKKGLVYWNWNQDFKPIVDNSCKQLANVPLEGLATDDGKNPNAFYITWLLSTSYRMNEGKPREGEISVKTIIDYCPDLKKYENSSRIRQMIMEPLIRDLDSLEWLNYTWHAPTGEKIDDIYSLSGKEFLKCYIKVDFSDFPKNKERLKAKEKKQAQADQALINARAKLKAKEEKMK